MTVSYAHCLRKDTPVGMTDGSAEGVIAGVASMGSPAVGHTYIVRLTKRYTEAWKGYPYEYASVPRGMLHIVGTDNLITTYKGEVQFYEESERIPKVHEARTVERRLFEPYRLTFSFADDDGVTYAVAVQMVGGAWVGEYNAYEGESEKPLYRGPLMHVVVEDRQGTLILNATMDEGGQTQHITLRGKCTGERSTEEEAP